MLYRIEYTSQCPPDENPWKGVAFFCPIELRYPKSNQIGRYNKFFFTEAGYRKFSNGIFAAIKNHNNNENTAFYVSSVRVIKVKNRDVDVSYRDKYQVAGLLKRK